MWIISVSFASMPNSTQNSESEAPSPASPQVFFDEQYCWNRFLLGDETAFTKIATHYYRHLLHYGLKFSPSKQTVEDALQDVLMHIWLHRATIRPTPSVKFYLMKAFRHQIFKTLKRSKTIQSAGWLDESLASDSSVEDAFIQHEQEGEIQARFDTLLNALPARQREVLYLRYYQELSTDEIAQLLAIKPQSVSNIVQRSLTKLREYGPIGLSLLLLHALSARMHSFQV